MSVFYLVNGPNFFPPTVEGQRGEKGERSLCDPTLPLLKEPGQVTTAHIHFNCYGETEIGLGTEHPDAIDLRIHKSRKML